MEAGKSTVVLAFDIYGTLLDTGAIAQALVENVDAISSLEKASELSTIWRRYQLEYTWRLNSMELYEPFDEVTRKSLLHAAGDMDINLEPDAVEFIMQAYHELPSFPDASPTIKKLMERSGVDVVVFSNGTQAMVSRALQTASLAPPTIPSYLASSAKRYKPSPAIYQGLADFLGKHDTLEDVWLVSGNPFDVTGARAFGMNAIWVDRDGKGWKDRLLQTGPTKVVHSLEEIAALHLS